MSCPGTGPCPTVLGKHATWRPLTLYATADGGDTWTPLQFGTRINRMRVLSGNVVYACGDRVYRWTP